MGLAKVRSDTKWLCLPCWKRLVADPGATPPAMPLKGICDECRAKYVPVSLFKPTTVPEVAKVRSRLG
jgi:hypothetical protein